MARQTILPAVVAALLAFAPVSGFAQGTFDQGEVPVDQPGRAAKAASPMIRLDFGAGRTISVRCGETDIAACVEAITPLAEKLAATPAAGHDRAGADGKPHHKGDGKKGWKEHGRKHDKAKHDKSKHDGPRHEKPAEPAPETQPLSVE